MEQPGTLPRFNSGNVQLAKASGSTDLKVSKVIVQRGDGTGARVRATRDGKEHLIPNWTNLKVVAGNGNEYVVDLSPESEAGLPELRGLQLLVKQSDVREFI